MILVKLYHLFTPKRNPREHEMVRAFALKHPKTFTEEDVNVLLRGNKEEGTQGIFTLREEQIKTLYGETQENGGKHKHKTASAQLTGKPKFKQGIQGGGKLTVRCSECDSTEHRKYWHKDGKFLCPKMKGQTPRSAEKSGGDNKGIGKTTSFKQLLDRVSSAQGKSGGSKVGSLKVQKNISVNMVKVQAIKDEGIKETIEGFNVTQVADLAASRTTSCK